MIYTFSLYELWRKSKGFVCLVIRIEHSFAFVCFLPQRVVLWLVFVSTFCFCLTWQFNQFVLLVQALIIFTLDCLDFFTAEQVHSKTQFRDFPPFEVHVRLDINFFLPVGGFSVPDPGIESVISVVTAVLQFYDSGLSGAQLHCVCPLRQTLPGQCTSQYTNSLESILPDLRMTSSRFPCNVYGLTVPNILICSLKMIKCLFTNLIQVNPMLSTWSQWWAVYVLAGMWALVLFSELPNRIKQNKTNLKPYLGR